MNELITSLLDLHLELDQRGIPVVVGGGLGLYLKRNHLATTNERTLFERLPQPRATNDVDLFLHADILADPARASDVAAAISTLGYEAIPGAELYQWKRELQVADTPREVKLDLLVGPVGEFRDRLHGDRRRLRPRGKSVGIHAHPTEEAVGIENEQLPIPVEGTLSSGAAHTATVFVPRAFPYLMMKLHAFEDRKNDAAKELGRHHALDVFTIVGMMTEPEYEDALRMGETCGEVEPVSRARRIVRDSFSTETAPGVLRLREHALYQPDFPLVEFIALLHDILPEPERSAAPNQVD